MFETGQILDGIYQVGEKIGQGGTGVVYAGWHLRLNKSIVIKRLRGTHNARAEADVLKNLHHPGLPQIYDFVQVGQEVYTVMDLIPGVSLDHLMEQGQRIKAATAMDWLRQLLAVLEYLHSRKPMILHNDIKPGNIMLRPNGELCLIDFNISMYADSGAITGYTAGYASPEQVALAQQILYRQTPTITLDPRSDLYSLAATMYALITGAQPSGQGPMPPLHTMQGLDMDPEFCRILDRAMSWKRELRYPSAAKMQAALQNYIRYCGHYRTYMVVQALCWGVGLALIAGGVYFLVGSVRQGQVEAFRSRYDQYCRVQAAGNEERAFALGMDLLSDNTCAEMLEDSPEILCAMLHESGNYYFDRGAYTQALQYYQQALEALPPADTNRSSYFCDTAMAAAEAGQPETAQAVLAQASAAGADPASILLTQAAVYAAQKDAAQCCQTVNRLLQQTENDPDSAALRAKACLLAAETAETAADKVQWLQKARACQETRSNLRRLGAAAYDAYSARPASGRQYLELSAECYTALCGSGYPTRQDRFNLAAVQLAQGRYNACRETLERLNTDYPNDFEILAELALTARMLGDENAMQRYLHSAETAWQAMSTEQRAAVPEQLRDQYEELKESGGQ